MLNDAVNVSVCHVAIPPEIMHDKTHVHNVVEETSKEYGWFVWMDFGLLGPIWIILFDPLEVVMGKVGNGLL